MEKYPEIKMLIGGKWVKSKKYEPIINPANNKKIGKLPVANEKNMKDAVREAKKGFKIWSQTAPAQRAKIINDAAKIIRQNQKIIAKHITQEVGKPIKQAEAEVIRGCEFLEWDAGEAQRLYGRIIPSQKNTQYYTIRQPIGVVAAFSPWNFPMSQPARKISGAIAAGCSIIIKPAEETPAGAIHIAKAFQKAGLPDGVLNILFGKPQNISQFLIKNKETRLVAFTGSTKIGKQLSECAAKYMTPVLMELGGHAPVIICDDVNPNIVAQICVDRKFRNAGQVCTSPTRFFVHQKLYKMFVKKFVAGAKKINVGNPINKNTQMGPVAHKKRIEALSEFVEDAKQKGAKIIMGGKKINKNGCFFQPTIITDAPNDANIMKEEPFGPIAVINPIKNLSEGIQKANETQYGLAAYAFTNNTANVNEITNKIEAGNISINTLEASLPETPFGGVKASGYGREGGEEGLHNYTVVKNISHNTKTK